MRVGSVLATHFIIYAVKGMDFERSVRICSIYKEDIPEDFDIPLLYDILYSKSDKVNLLCELLRMRGSYLANYEELGASIKACYNVRYNNLPCVNVPKIERLKLFQYNMKLTNF